MDDQNSGKHNETQRPGVRGLERTLRLSQYSVEHTDSPLYWIDEACRIHYANGAASRSLGYTPEELLGLTAYDVDPTLTKEKWARAWQRIKGGNSINFESVERRKDGSLIPVEIKMNYMSFEGEEFAFAIVRDITDRRRAEMELRQEKERAQRYLDIVEVILVALDVDHRIILINRRGCDLLGYNESELMGKNWFDLCVPDFDREKTRAVFARLMAGEIEPIEYFENYVVTKDKEHRLVAWHNAVIRGEDGRIQASLSSGEDITERRAMQETIIQSEKMMTVGGLAAGMAHEINNPLSGIMQGIQNIFRRLSPELPANREVAKTCGVDLEAMQSYLDKRDIPVFLAGIQEAGARASQIVKNMLHFSRPGDTDRVPTDINELLDHALGLATSDFDLKKKYDFRRIQIEREFDRTIAKIPCVASELEQVVLNIVKNAAQAMTNLFEQKKEKPRLVLRTMRDNGWVRIEIEDNGPGMDEKTRRRVFEPFFTTKEVGSGTGLGLSVSYFIVTNNHGGTIDVESRPGAGTRFIIRLPSRENA